VACRDSPCHRKASTDKFGPHGQSTKPYIDQQESTDSETQQILFQENNGQWKYLTLWGPIIVPVQERM
jgi:hypothetical protein